MSKEEDVAAAQALLDAALSEPSEGVEVDANDPQSAARAVAASNEQALAAADAKAQADALRAHLAEVAAVAAAAPKESEFVDLDKRRPYGTVGGEHPLNAKFWQDGQYFDNRGKLIKE